jgi:hypothetical protein
LYGLHRSGVRHLRNIAVAGRALKNAVNGPSEVFRFHMEGESLAVAHLF